MFHSVLSNHDNIQMIDEDHINNNPEYPIQYHINLVLENLQIFVMICNQKDEIQLNITCISIIKENSLIQYV